MNNKNLFSCTVFIGLLLMWFLLSFNANPYIFPSPSKIFFAFLEVFSQTTFIFDSLSSLLRLIAGFFLGLIPAVILGILIGQTSVDSSSVGKSLESLRFVPPLALVPLMILWFGIGEFSKYLIIAWTVFFPVYISILLSSKNMDTKLIWVAKSFGATKKQVLLKVVFPYLMPSIVSGARVGMGLAFSVIIAAELVGAFSGLGFRLWFFQSVFRVDLMLVYIALLIFYGFVLDRFLKLVGNKLFFWGEKYE